MGWVMGKWVMSGPRCSSVVRMGLLMLATLTAGCVARPKMLPYEQQTPIDRSLVVTPQGYALHPLIRSLSAPVAIDWDEEGSTLIAQGGNYDDEPSIIGFKKDGSFFQVYPYGRRMFVDIGKPRFTMYGPIGGMKAYKGRIYVSHRDENGKGVISALDYTGGHTTIFNGGQCDGDHSITDLAIDKTKNPARLYFGIGSATNSGVVGIDNWNWVRNHTDVYDIPAVRLRLMGFRFDSPNPFSGLFGPADIAVTAPFQPFNVSNQTEIVPGTYANGAIYYCAITGGDVKLVAHGIRYPRGIGWNDVYCYFTNQGMELRGTRPVKDDPDALLNTAGSEQWFGWPDWTTDLRSIEDDRYQPPLDMIARTGYPFHVLAVINSDKSQLAKPESHRADTLQGVFSPLSGVAKFDFVPDNHPINPTQFHQVLVALSGDSAPLSTSGRPVRGPLGYKVVTVNLGRGNFDNPSKYVQNVTDFVANTAGGPGSKIDPKNPNLLERPIDVKFHDGNIFILDAGRMHIADGRQVYEDGTGKVFILMPQKQPIMYHNP